MDSTAAFHIKKLLLQICIENQHKRVEHARKAMNDAQQAANSEERSTAGDKYDTSRAMSQNVRDMNAKQLQEALKDLAILQQINPELITSKPVLGSVIQTNAGDYFIAVSGGPYKIEKDTFYALSTASPLGQALLQSKAGDTISFRGKPLLIKHIF